MCNTNKMITYSDKGVHIYGSKAGYKAEDVVAAMRETNEELKGI